MIGLAVRRYGWTRARGAGGVHAQRRVGARRSGRIGSIEPGKRADLVVLDVPVEHVPYRFGRNPVAR